MNREFDQALKRSAGVMRRGLMAGRALRAAGFVLAAVALFGLSDYWLGWETGARKLWAAVLLALLAAGLLAAALRGWLLSATAIARHADRAAQTQRREIETALELSRQPVNDTGSLKDWLSQQAIQRAAQCLRELPQRSLWPRRDVMNGLRWAMAALVVIGALVAVHPQAARRIATRLLHPATDLPPYSPYDFNLGPEPARVVYGKEIQLNADIAGPAIEEDVRLLTRPLQGGTQTALPTFRESGARFARKLEGVTQPLEFAFAIGRARSAWRTVEIQYEPRLEQAEVEVRPPAYSGQRALRFMLGSEDLRGLRGSEVTLRAVSNRPLGGGTLEGRAPQGREVLARVTGQPPSIGGTEVEFRWRIEADLVWTLDLEDVRGGHMAEKVLIAQRLIPDEKPKVELVSPGPMALATPGSDLALAWDVDDDFGLDRTELVRSADGYRDRAQKLPEGAGEKRLRIERQVKLASLGVRPGQTLEFLLEARDRNPSLMGVGTATAAKVHIISEEDYAEQVRERTTLDEFIKRYSLLREQLERAQKSLEELAKAAASGDAKKLAEAREAAAKAQREAAKWFETFAKDFPAYASDEALAELSGGLQQELEKNAQELEQNPAMTDPAQAKALAEAMRERLQPKAEQLAQQEQDADELARIGAVMEMAAELQTAREEQREVSEALAHLAHEMALGESRNRHKLPELRQRQQANQERIARVQRELPERLERLPDSHATMRDGARRVLDQLDLLQVSKQMGDAVTKSGAGQLTGAAADSVLARANLDQILGDPKDDFCKMCQGGMPGFCMGSGMAQQTLAQMLAALRGRSQGGQKRGQKPGSQGPGGFGAVGGSGSTMPGIQLEIPLMGPPRVSLRNSPQQNQGRRSGDAKDPGATARQTQTAAQSDLPASAAPKPSGQAWKAEDVPPKYRDAVKKYFTPEAGQP